MTTSKPQRFGTKMMNQHQRLMTAALMLLLSVGLGCSEDQKVEQSKGNKKACVGKCDGEGSQELLKELEGRQDPVANWLRAQESVTDERGVAGDYESIMSGINDALGCTPDQMRNFVISDKLVSDTEDVRLAGVVCATDKNKNFSVFMSTPDVTDEGDLDARGIELFAWDDETREFRFYRTRAAQEEGRMEVEVEPAECAECHMGPVGLMAVDSTTTRMMPIMNELTEPWSHWNAEPLFRSQDFVLPGDIEDRDVYQSLTSGTMLGSASELEQIIRNAQSIVVSTRYKSRKEELSVTQAMGLLRPMFCEEQLNYASEKGDSGALAMGVVLDDNIRNLYAKIDSTSWSWPWFYNQTKTVRFDVAPRVSDRLVTVPVRGQIDQEMELKFTRALGAQALLQIRALDWQNPILSDFRCGMWKDAVKRFRQETPEFVAEDNADLMKELLPKVVSFAGTPIASGAEDKIVVLDRADLATLAKFEEQLDAGDIPEMVCEEGDSKPCTCGDAGFCTATLNQFGQHIQFYVTDVEKKGRDLIRQKRAEQVCTIARDFDAQPFLEGIEQCEN